MSKQLENHWAVCEKNGAIRYNEWGHAEIYETRSLARIRAATIKREQGEKMHVEKVEIK